jgi:hypothetical protein
MRLLMSALLDFLTSTRSLVIKSHANGETSKVEYRESDVAKEYFTSILLTKS